MYRRFQEVELQEYPAQLAMIMVTTETNMKGISIFWFFSRMIQSSVIVKFFHTIKKLF